MYTVKWFDDHDLLKDDIDKLFVNDSYGIAWKCNTLSTVNDHEYSKTLVAYFKQTSFWKLLNEYCDMRGKGVDIWVNKYDENHYQEPHDHLVDIKGGKVLFSFCYFFDVPDEPLFYFIDGSEQIFINERNGMVVFFDPSKLHGVDFNPTNKQRKTIAGNVIVKT